MSALALASCAAPNRVWGTLVAYGEATGGYASDLGYSTVHGEPRTVSVELPEVCLKALGRGAYTLDQLRTGERETSPLINALTTVDAIQFCRYELDRLNAEGKLVLAAREEDSDG